MGNKYKCNLVARGCFVSEGEWQDNSYPWCIACARIWDEFDLHIHPSRQGIQCYLYRGTGQLLNHMDWRSPIAIGVRSKRLYRLQMDTPKALINNNSSRDQGELWHRRMDHIHYGALRFLHETMTGIPEVSIEHNDVCRGCVLGKFVKETFPRSENKSYGILDFMHSDICGPMSTKISQGLQVHCDFYRWFLQEDLNLFLADQEWGLQWLSGV